MGSLIVQDEIGKLSGHGVSTGVIIIGVIILLVSSLGTQASCSGDLHKWSFIYAIMLLFVLITTSILCSVVFQETTVKENLSSGWNVADLETKRTVQTNLKCCGFTKVSDRSILPCNWLEPCEPKLHKLVDLRMSSMRSWIFTLLALEIIGFIITIITWCKQSKKYEGKYGVGSGDPTTSGDIQFHR